MLWICSVTELQKYMQVQIFKVINSQIIWFMVHKHKYYVTFAKKNYFSRFYGGFGSLLIVVIFFSFFLPSVYVPLIAYKQTWM